MAERPDIIIINGKVKIYVLVDVAISSVKNVMQKETENYKN